MQQKRIYHSFGVVLLDSMSRQSIYIDKVTIPQVDIVTRLPIYVLTH